MIIGRKKECGTLWGLLEKKDSQFCAVYGRRRVGKTYLIREAFNYQFTFQHTGVAKGDLRNQLVAFRDSLRNAGLSQCPVPKTWFEAFDKLKLLIDSAPAGKKVIFIDELPWMDTPKSKMVSALEHFWNGWATARPQKDIVLIVCGSATSWITKKLLKNKDGLRGRITEKIKVAPFTLSECEQYASAAGLSMVRKDVLEMYMILGGIPYYWSFLRRGLSVAQNVDELFFSENAKLRDEFGALYQVLFNRPEKFIKVIEALNGKKAGLSRQEILAKTGIEDGGTFKAILEDLEECGFIRHYTSFGKKEKDAIYQLIDNYTLFYYHCILKDRFADENYWSHTYLTSEHNTWARLAFERVCLQHIPQIKKELGISGILSNVASWRASQTETHAGAQIDLLIDRGDNVVTVCEMKYSKDIFVIDASYAKALESKLSVFRTVSGTRKALHLALITTFGVSHNKYRNLVQNDLTMDCLFG